MGVANLGEVENTRRYEVQGEEMDTHPPNNSLRGPEERWDRARKSNKSLSEKVQ